METIRCAAIKRVDGIIIAGRNHSFIIQHSPKGTCKKNSEQGFITSEARFVGRSEAAEIAYKAEQIKKPTNLLFSEDITQDNPWAGEVIDKLQAERDEYHDQYHLCEAKLLSHRSLIKQGEEAYRRLKERQLTQSQTEYLVKFLKLRLMSKPNQAIEGILEALKEK